MPPVPLGVVASSSIAKFDPLSIGGLLQWYDASDAATFTYSSGTSVSQWANKASAFRHLTQSNGSYQPDRSGTNNGLTTVKFAQDYLGHGTAGWWPFLIDGTNFSVFAVAKIATGATYGMLVGAGYTNPGMDTLFVMSSHLSRHIVSNSGATGTVVANSANHMFQPGTWFVQSIVSDADHTNPFSRSVMRINGSSVLDGNSQTAAPSGGVDPPGFFLGTRQDGDIGGVYLALGSEIAEVLVYVATLTDAQVNQVNDYLVGKWLTKTTAFVPTDVAGCVHWLDAQDDASFTYSSGTEVSQWNDKSGGNRHFTQSTGSIQPSRRAFLNGKPVVHFAIGDDLQGINALPWDNTTQSIDVFVVARRPNNVANYCYIYNNECFGLTFYSNSAFYSYARHGINWYPSTWASDNVWHTCEFTWTYSNTAAYMFLDGGSVYTPVAGQTLPVGTNPHHAYLGATQQSVQVAEVIVYVTTGGIGAVNREKVREYLSAKWFSLPAGTAFDPTTVSNLKLWYDMSDVSTMTFSSGQSVSQLNDKSGNGRHVSNSTASEQAQFTGSRLLFDAATTDAYRYAGSSGVNTSAVTAFVVSGATVDRDQAMFTLCGPGQDFDTPTAIFMSSAGYAFRTGAGAGAYSGTPMHFGLYRGVWRPDHTMDVYWNGTRGATASSSGTYGLANTTVVVGGRWVNGAIHSGTRWVGTICEILIYDRVLTDTECANIESGLRVKWGLPTWI